MTAPAHSAAVVPLARPPLRPLQSLPAGPGAPLGAPPSAPPSAPLGARLGARLGALPGKLLPALRVALPALLAAQAAAAQEVWRCGTDGRTFTDRPCPGGQALELPPAPSAQQQAEAAQVALRQAALAQRMRDERLALERERAQAAARAAALAERQARVDREERLIAALRERAEAPPRPPRLRADAGGAGKRADAAPRLSPGQPPARPQPQARPAQPGAAGGTWPAAAPGSR